jgi:hypothetical protein
MKMTLLLPVMALLACACTQQPAANPASQAAATNGPAQCAAGGLAPGSQAYGDCVNALAGGGGAPAANAAQMQANIQAQMDQQRAQMQQQMNQAQQNPACTTTRDANNNVSTVCP